MSDTREPYRDFARGEIYAFLRLTAIISTFLISASLVVLSLSGKSFIPS